MSLLMDALKKAEQAQQASEAAAEDAVPPQPLSDADDIGFPPLDAAEPSPQVTPALLLEDAPTPAAAIPPTEPEAAPLELSLEAAPSPKDDFAAPPPPAAPEPPPEPSAVKTESPPPQPAPRPAAPPRQTAASQQSARNVFAAKSGGAGSKPALSSSRLVVIAVAVIGLLAALGGGYYLYSELNASASFVPLNPPPAPPTAPSALPPQPAAEAARPLPPPQETAAEAEAPPAPAPRREAVAADTAAAQDKDGIRIQHGSQGGQINPQLSRAYQALLAGDLAQAEEEYRKTLRADRNNRDALLGMAVIQERRGDAETAAGIYSRLLELDPNDGTAQARLIALGAYADPVRSESRIKALLSQQPESDTLQFALGNLYAAQSRWPEAQQAYFRAFQRQPANPDYLYNLAVSLDHMGQNKLALEYYRRTLAAAGQPHAFSADAVKTRIGALEQAPGQGNAAPRQ